MNIELIVPLVLLALIDSTSFGTLLIPLFLMLAPGRPRPGRILLFLATVAAFYLLLGIALLVGASSLSDTLRAMETSQPLLVTQLIVGVGLMALGTLMEPWTESGKERRLARRAEKLARSGPSLQNRMRERAIDASAPVGTIIVLALIASLVEAASMVPYLAAIGFLTASELSLAGRAAVLFGYCLVMIAPALLLLAARLFLHDRIAPTLKRLEAFLSRHANGMIAWVIFLVGLYLTSTSLSELGWV
ncbi:GAP family protein [Luteimonas sp. MJ250]|uniref:GAP family protein n=1 Tax=Luteimonas sp. MJ250 TaxID=3129236 RepID=UPI0031BB27A9